MSFLDELDREPRVLFDELDADGNVIPNRYGEVGRDWPVVAVEDRPPHLVSFEAPHTGQAAARAAEAAGCRGARKITFGAWRNRRGGAYVAAFLGRYAETRDEVVSWVRID